jgi:O-antigen ligase
MFEKKVQKILNYFIFFLVFPSINLFGSSITFYIFIYLITLVGINFINYEKRNILFYFLLFSLFLSIIFKPSMERDPGFGVTLKFVIQFIYWITVSLFTIFYFKNINFSELSKWAFYGTLVSIIGFYIFPFNFGVGPIFITLQETRNSFVFDLLCAIPISFIYINSNFSKRNKIILLWLFIISMLFTNGRSGGVIIFIESILISIFIFPNFIRNFKIIIIPIFIFILLFSFSTEKLRIDLANSLTDINPRLSKLILAEEDDDEGDLSMDKSWLHRVLMVDKSIEIFAKYPFTGIGPNNFRYYDSPLKSLENYQRLSNESEEWYNNRSAHNSYIQILSELGLFGMIPLVLIILIPIIFFIKKIIYNNKEILLLPFVSIIGISIHFYAISALTGAIPFFIFGCCWGFIKNNSNLKS